MVLSKVHEFVNSLDEALQSHDLLVLQQTTQDISELAVRVFEDATLDQLQSCVLTLVHHIDSSWAAVPAGYSELLNTLFDIVNRVIREDPEVYRAFIDPITSQTDLNLPWHRLDLPRRGVAVLYNFVPFADTGASVASKRLRQFGGAVDVLSCSSIGKKATDFTPYRISRPYVREAVTLPIGPAWGSWAPQYKFIQMALEEIVRNEAEGTAYDFIYTRAMWVPSHYVGALKKLQTPEIEWIAEFSDPLSLDVEGLPRAEHPPKNHEVFDELVEAFEREYGVVDESQRGIFRMAELLSYAFADRIIFTNDLQMQTMLNHVDHVALRERIIRHAQVSNHPTLPREYYKASDIELKLDPQFIHLGYFGQFYATRGLGDITRAIRMLPEHLADRIRLHVFTTYVPEEAGGSRPVGMDRKLYESYVQRTVTALGSSGLDEQVELHPALPYLDFLGVLDDFDYLLVNDAKSGVHHAVNPYLPSKYSDYKGSKGKIWALCEEGSCLDQSPVQVKTQLGDTNAVRRFLIDVLAEHEEISYVG